ncbi:estradiol 17-beta-dehydrogenase 11 [Lucilia cuprina]|uniref:estradiol 17-beta-dehydrogenase 11 n=1 Tax=Lucilia cuprina TaxID=7375 RepID=UPI001F06DA68|nr:estradiol 17-beta-dehydrogenase 11 [Lucilia cuprina]
MLEENNNGHISNGHLPNSKVPTTTTTTTTTTTSAEADMAQSTLLTKFMTWIDPFVDFSWFIICSIGFIFQVSLLINNAGVVSGLHLLDTPDHLIERSFNVNVMAHFWTTKAFLPKMIENQRGHIATIASLAGHVGITKLVDYCASKFAAVGFDEALRLELEVLGHTNIQTTCVCPFFIQQTGMFDDVNARWVPTLNPNDVADRVITAIQKNEKIAIIPGYIKLLLSFKWTFPWGCIAGLLRRLVPDASPHGLAQKSLLNFYKKSSFSKPSPGLISPAPIITDIGSNVFKEPLTKAGSLLIQRSPSLGERVL